MRSRRLALNMVVVIAGFGADKVLALIRDWLVGRRFGAGYEYDAFTAAVQAPELLFTLIAGGALLAAFIPVFSEKLAKGPRDDAWRLASGVTNIVVLVLLAFGLAVGLFADPITARWLVPEFSADKQVLTAELLRIILLQTFIFGVAGVIVGILHSHQHFFLPAIAPVFYNLGQIFGVVFLAPRLGILGLTWGMVLGAAGYLLIQTPALWRFGARYFPTLALRIPGLGRIGWLMVPRLVSLGLVELADVFFVRLGSRLPDGHLSAYFWGWRLMQFPETLFGTAVAQVFFPTFAELANAGDWDGLRQRANDALRVILTLTVPSAVALILLGRPLVSLIGGAFDAQAVELVHAALVIMSVRLVGEAVLEIGARLFYAQQDTATPMFAAALGQSVSIGLGYVLIGPLGFRGLAVATTVGFWLESGLLLGLAHRRLGHLVDRGVVTALGRALVGSAVLGFGISAAQLALPVGGGRLQMAATAGAAAFIGVTGYLIALFVLRSPELRALPALLGRYGSRRAHPLLDEDQA
jgi:putative peptidoglycan lipid II flippase